MNIESKSIVIVKLDSVEVKGVLDDLTMLFSGQVNTDPIQGTGLYSLYFALMSAKSDGLFS